MIPKFNKYLCTCLVKNSAAKPEGMRYTNTLYACVLKLTYLTEKLMALIVCAQTSVLTSTTFNDRILIVKMKKLNIWGLKSNEWLYVYVHMYVCNDN